MFHSRVESTGPPRKLSHQFRRVRSKFFSQSCQQYGCLSVHAQVFDDAVQFFTSVRHRCVAVDGVDRSFEALPPIRGKVGRCLRLHRILANLQALPRLFLLVLVVAGLLHHHHRVANEEATEWLFDPPTDAARTLAKQLTIAWPGQPVLPLPMAGSTTNACGCVCCCCCSHEMNPTRLRLCGLVLYPLCGQQTHANNQRKGKEEKQRKGRQNRKGTKTDGHREKKSQNLKTSLRNLTTPNHDPSANKPTSTRQQNLDKRRQQRTNIIIASSCVSSPARVDLKPTSRPTP